MTLRETINAYHLLLAINFIAAITTFNNFITTFKCSVNVVFFCYKCEFLKIIGPSYFLIRLAQTKITLFIFVDKLGNKGKRKFSASIAVFLCNMLRRNKGTIFLSQIYLYLYNLYPTNTTYFCNSLWHISSSWWQRLLWKTYGLRYQNGTMVSDSFAYRKTKTCKQHGFYVLGLKF